MPTPLATWNRARGVWETEQVSLLCGHSEPFSQTWPNWGMTRAGTAYAQPMWEHLTADFGSSSSPGLLPTPTAVRQSGRCREGYGPQDLLHQMVCDCSRLLPTPTASDRFGPGDHGDGGMDLRTAVDTLFPTPRATDGTKGGPNQRGSSGDLMLPSAVTLLPTPMATDYKGSSGTDRRPAGDDDLPTRLERLLPTPTAMDSKASGGSSPSDVTLTDAVVRTQLGAITNPRFADGSAA